MIQTRINNFQIKSNLVSKLRDIRKTIIKIKFHQVYLWKLKKINNFVLKNYKKKIKKLFLNNNQVNYQKLQKIISMTKNQTV